MTATRTDPPQVDEGSPPPPGRAVWGWVTGLGVVIAAGILGSWWLGSLPEENIPDIGRVVFGNIPGLVVAAFYVVVASAAFVSVLLFADRARNWQRGAADDRSRMLKRRLHELRRGLSMRTLLRDPGAGLMHTAIYIGFLVLFAGTVTLEIDHILPADLKFLEGGFYEGYSFVLDLFALVFLGGLALGGAAPVRQPPVAAQVEDQARGRPDPPDPGPDRARRPGRRGGPHRRRRPTRLRDLVVRRLPASASWSRRARRPGCTRGSGCSTCSPSSPSCSSSPPQSCGT